MQRVCLALLAALAVPVAAQAGTREQPEPAFAGAQTERPVAEPGMEVPGLRTRTSRTYRAPNGDLVARVWGSAVNFRDDQKRWQKIDARLRREGGGFANRAGELDMRLPDSLGKGAVRAGTGDGVVAFRLSGARDVPARIDGATATYLDALPEVDVEYEAQGEQLKETLTLSKGAQSRYAFALDTSRGLRLERERGGAYTARDRDDDVVFVLAAPFVYDGAGKLGPDGSVEVSVTDGQLVLQIDESWLKRALARGKVTLDPVVGLPQAMQDTAIESSPGWDDVDQSEDIYLRVGGAGGSDPYDTRALLKFDVESVLPRGADVRRASMYLSSGFDITGTPKTFGAFEAATPWTDTATWQTRNGSAPWVTGGGDPTGAAQSAVRVTEPYQWVTFGLTKLARKWATGTPNRGVVVRAIDNAETPENYHGFISSDHPDDRFRPSIDIAYRVWAGKRPGRSYLEERLSDHENFSVDLGSGNVILRSEDAPSSPGTARIYQSQLTEPAAGAGVKTTLSVDPWLDFSAADDSVSYEDQWGAHYRFERFDPDTWRSDELDAVLRRDAGGRFELTYLNGDEWTFPAPSQADGATFADAVTDSAGQRTTFTRGPNGQATGVESAGRRNDLSFSPWGPITRIAAHDGTVTTFDADSTGALTRAARSDGSETRYRYSDDGRQNMEHIELADGGKVSVAHDVFGRATSVQRFFPMAPPMNTRIASQDAYGEFDNWRINYDNPPGALCPGAVSETVLLKPSGAEQTYCVNERGAAVSPSLPLDHDLGRCDAIWVGSASDVWSNPANWSPAEVPSRSDRACAPPQATMRITEPTAIAELVAPQASLRLESRLAVAADRQSSVGTLHMSEVSLLAGVGGMRVAESFRWDGAGEIGHESTLTLGPDSTGVIEGDTLPKEVLGTLRNEGHLRLLAGSVSASGARERRPARIENSGTLDLDGRGLESTEHATLVNTGQVRRTQQGDGVVRWRFVNAGGEVQVLAGKLDLWHGTPETDEFAGRFVTAATDAEVGLAGWNGPPGTALADGTELVGNIRLRGQRMSVGRVQADNATLQVDSHLEIRPGSEVRVRSLTIDSYGASVAGPGTLRVLGTFTWTNGIIHEGGRVVIAPDAVGDFSGTPGVDGTSIFLAGTLRNEGRLTLTEGEVGGRSKGRLENRGLLNLNGRGLIYWWNWRDPSENATLVNTGTIRKTSVVDAQRTRVTWRFANTGQVQQGPGTLEFVGDQAQEAPAPAESYGPVSPTSPNEQRACAGKPVDCATGNQFESQTDLAFDGLGLGLEQTRTYNSQAAASATAAGVYGYGWTGSYRDRLVVDHAQQRVRVHRSDGSEVPFLKQSDGTFDAPAWVHATLTEDGDGTFRFGMPDRSSMQFSPSGRLVSLQDANGNQSTLSYAADGRLQSVTDAAGRSLRYAYNGEGQVASIELPGVQKVLYGYDSGELVSVRYDGESDDLWGFGYDDTHQLTSMTDARGGETTTTYDESHRAVEQTDALNRTRRWTYDGSVTLVSNPGGDVTRMRFLDTRPLTITKAHGTPDASTTTFEYDEDRRPIAVIDEAGKRTTFGYDEKGNRTRVTDAEGRVSRTVYDGHRQVTSVTRPSGRTTTIDRDTRGNPVEVRRTLVRDDGSQQTVSSSGVYDSRGLLDSETDAKGNTWTFEHDDAGNRTTAVSPSGRRTTATYDGASRVRTTVSARGNRPGADSAAHRTTIDRDGRGRATRVTGPGGAIARMEYDAADNPTRLTDADGVSRTTEYDAENQPTRLLRSGGTAELTSYDDNGLVSETTDRRGGKTRYERDAAGKLKATIDPAGRRTAFTYDDAGRVATSTDPAGRQATYDYDDTGLLLGVDYVDSDTPDVTFGYDVDGRRTSMSDGTGTTTTRYDSLDRLVRTVDGGGRQVDYGYDLSDDVTSITYPNGQTLQREIDADGQLIKTTDWEGNSVGFDYDADGNHTRTRFPGGQQHTDHRSYDPKGDLTAIAFGDQSGLLGKLDYTRTGAGRVDTETSIVPLGAATADHEYDDQGRLTKAGTEQFTYDVGDGLTRIGSLAPLRYGQIGQLLDSGTAPDQRTFSYDVMGARTGETGGGRPNVEYRYDQAENLRRVAKTGSDAVDYAYDGDGLRVRRQRNGTATGYAWDHATGGLPLMLSDGSNSYVYGPDGNPVSHLASDGETVFYHQDQLGSTRRLTNADGDVVGDYRYDAHGNVLERTGDAETPVQFAGEYRDPDTGLVYLRARHYDPATGQFLTRDPLEAISGSPYGYADGDPVNRTDPSGLMSIQDVSDFAAGFGDMVSFGGTRAIRGLWGANENVDFCSGAYGGGGYAAYAHQAASGGVAAYKLLGGAARRADGWRALLAGETGSFLPGELVGAVMRRKKGSIQRAPMPKGSPSWDDVRDMTIEQVEAAARANEPGFRTMLKLLQDKRFDK